MPTLICISSGHPRRQTLDEGAPPCEGRAGYQALAAAEIRLPPFVSAADEHSHVIPSTPRDPLHLPSPFHAPPEPLEVPVAGETYAQEPLSAMDRGRRSPCFAFRPP
jgi:hypothetical protein